MSDDTQALCFRAGGNSLLGNDRLLTTDNHKPPRDRLLLECLARPPARSLRSLISLDQAGDRRVWRA